MKKTLSSFAPLLALVAVAALCITGHFINEARAGDQWFCQLTSTDAGATNVCALPPSTPGAQTAAGVSGQQFDIYCAIPSCFKTDTLTGSPLDGGFVGDAGLSCLVDVPAYVYSGNSLANQNASACSGLGAMPKCRFIGGKHLGIVALAQDAGNPNCSVSSVIGGG